MFTDCASPSRAAAIKATAEQRSSQKKKGDRLVYSPKSTNSLLVL